MTSARARMSGQAMVEASVALVLLAVVVTAIPSLAAYHDVQRTALRAAREASYTAGWSGMGDPERLAQRTLDRLRELPWAHPADGRPLITGDDAARTTHADAAPPGRAAELMDFVARPLGEASATPGSEVSVAAPPLNRAGYHSVSVAVEVPAIRGAPEPFASLALRLTERASTLTEAWNAGAPAMVTARVRPIVPSAQLQRLAGPMQVLAAPLRLIEPAFEQLCVGLIEPDLVPEPRLGARVGRSRAAGDRARACP